ncbi:hypothetical protein NDU88_004066 [Pleurodeles waltl]|uniref:Uncharacterized protein n=1 Tax=Pleurodeles waltl TaxID=8319 RepID=A0AAV7QHA7_PLEWA|nr:hypothetical protein NDU88_004066 [Pleurodeles waltl]
MTYDAEGVINIRREDGRGRSGEKKEEPRTRGSRSEEIAIGASEEEKETAVTGEPTTERETAITRGPEEEKDTVEGGCSQPNYLLYEDFKSKLAAIPEEQEREDQVVLKESLDSRGKELWLLLLAHDLVDMVYMFSRGMAEEKVCMALALLQQAGRMDLVRPEAFAPGRPARKPPQGWQRRYWHVRLRALLRRCFR